LSRVHLKCLKQIIKIPKYLTQYCPLGAVVSPPSEHLWKTLTYWSRQCLTAPPPSGCSWTKCGKIFDAGRTTSYVLNSVVKQGRELITDKLKSEFQYSNSFSNAIVTNGRRSSNWSSVAEQSPFVSLFSADTGLILPKILHDIVALVALLNHGHTRRYNAFRFRTPEQRVKVVDFDVCQNAQKFIGYRSNVPWATAKHVSFVISIQVTIYAERLTKIGLVVAEIFGQVCWFLPFPPKRCSCYPHNLWGYWTECNWTKIVHNVEKFILFNILNSELRYYNPFWNRSATKEIGPRKTPIFDFSCLPWQRPLRNQKRGLDRSYSNKYLLFGAKIAKISPVDPEIICLHLKNI